jgi:hypothetical protein
MRDKQGKKKNMNDSVDCLISDKKYYVILLLIITKMQILESTLKVESSNISF